MARGSAMDTRLSGAFESGYGADPGSGYMDLPVVTEGLGGDEPLLQDDTLAHGRGPRAPDRDALTVDGDFTAPLEAESIGVWLKLLLGAPTTTGAGPYTHEFTAATATLLPSLFLRRWHPGPGRGRTISGLTASSMAISLGSDGRPQAAVSLRGRDEQEITADPGAGNPWPAYTRFTNPQGALSQAGAPYTDVVVGADLTIENNLDVIRPVDGTGLIGQPQAMMQAITGTITARAAAGDLDAIAKPGQSTALRLVWSNGTESLTFDLPAVHLARARSPLSGPQGIEQSFEFEAAIDGAGALLTATLVNNVASY